MNPKVNYMMYILVYNHRQLQQFHRNIYDPTYDSQDIQYDYHKNTWFDSSLVPSVLVLGPSVLVLGSSVLVLVQSVLVLVQSVLVASVLVASVESVESVVGVSQGVRS
jgi:hypothetical protein